jgi:hypothetical protein
VFIKQLKNLDNFKVGLERFLYKKLWK